MEATRDKTKRRSGREAALPLIKKSESDQCVEVCVLACPFFSVCATVSKDTYTPASVCQKKGQQTKP